MQCTTSQKQGLVETVTCWCRDLETAEESCSAQAAVQQLQRSKRKSLPVVDARGNLVCPCCAHTSSAVMLDV